MERKESINIIFLKEKNKIKRKEPSPMGCSPVGTLAPHFCSEVRDWEIGGQSRKTTPRASLAERFRVLWVKK